MTQSNLPPEPDPDLGPAVTPPPPNFPPATAPPPAVDYATAGYPGPYAGPEPDKDSRTMAMLSHLLTIFTGFLGPLVIWLIRKDTSPFVNDQGKEALNFQLTLLIGYVIGIVTSCVFVGFFILLICWIAGLVFAIMGTMQSNNGVAYRYPFNIRFIK